MNNKDIYNWLFASLDEIVDCEYETETISSDLATKKE